jgi:hypothetical protein
MDGVEERLHGLKVTAARLAAERNEARQAGLNLQLENCALVAAAFTLAADGIRREEELQAALARANGKAAAQVRIITGLEGLLADYYSENWRLGEHVARLASENGQLRTELDDDATRDAANGRRKFWRTR